MQKMITDIKTLAALLIASATFASCSNDDNATGEPPVAPSQQTYTMTIEAAKGGEGTTRALSLEDKRLNATWATSENVYVKKGDTWATGSLQPQADGATATLKGSLTGITPEASDVLTLQFPRSGALDYTGQVGTLEDIAEKYDYATATVTVKSVSAMGNIIPDATTTTFENQQAILKFTLIDQADGTTPLNATQLVVNDGTTDYTITPASATNVIYVAIPGFTDKTVTLTATVGDATYTFEKIGASFTNGQYCAITVKMAKATPTVLATAVDLGLSVKWANMNVGAEKESDYGLFFAWGETTGYGSDTSDGYNFDWPSYSLCGGSGTTLTKYNNNANYGTVDNKTTLEAADDAATANWGSSWRMPTYDELNDLYATKNNSNYTWTWTTVDNHKGWRITYKSTGANIFLPASGYRSGTSLSSQGNSGFLWSSSLLETGARSGRNLSFNSRKPSMVAGNRCWGLSVRPVQDK